MSSTLKSANKLGARRASTPATLVTAGRVESTVRIVVACCARVSDPAPARPKVSQRLGDLRSAFRRGRETPNGKQISKPGPVFWLG